MKVEIKIYTVRICQVIECFFNHRDLTVSALILSNVQTVNHLKRLEENEIYKNLHPERAGGLPVRGLHLLLAYTHLLPTHAHLGLRGDEHSP